MRLFALPAPDAMLITATLFAALMLASCGGPRPLALPEEPVERAATCGIVAAASARLALPNVQAPLPLEARGRIIHYALLAATAGGRFSPPVAGEVSRRMAALQAKITGGKWQQLAPACAAAYPETARDPVLPAGRLDSELGCSALATFMADAMESDKADYRAAVNDYRRLRSSLSDRIGPGLRSRAGADLAAQRAASDEALAATARLGPPVVVLDLCLKRFG